MLPGSFGASRIRSSWAAKAVELAHPAAQRLNIQIRIPLAISEIINEPRQPSRDEKNATIVVSSVATPLRSFCWGNS